MERHLSRDETTPGLDNSPRIGLAGIANGDEFSNTRDAAARLFDIKLARRNGRVANDKARRVILG